MSRQGVAAVLLAMCLTGCSTWQRSADVLLEPVPERTPLELWTGRKKHRVHGVVVQGDSIRAVPYWNPPGCDSCAIFLAVADVDSVRAPVDHAGRSAAFLVGMFVVVYAVLAFASLGGAGS